MQVYIKSLKVEMEIKNSGIELEVRSTDGTKQLGDFYATKTGIVWCDGKTQQKNGIKIEWEKLILLCRSEETLRIALKAASQHNK